MGDRKDREGCCRCLRWGRVGHRAPTLSSAGAHDVCVEVEGSHYRLDAAVVACAIGDVAEPVGAAAV